MLVVAYYFPPMGLSGVQRVAKFVKYLPEHGWRPTVLTAAPGGYFAYDASLLADVEAAGTEVVRTASWDPTRLFGRGRTVALPAERARRWWAGLSQFAFIPDNKVGWWPHAGRAGRRLLRAGTFDAIFSSAPPYTAHLVAVHLARWSGLPLITDFRDDWVGNPRHVYPTPLHRALHRRLEHRVLRASRHATTINTYIRDALLARNTRPGFTPSVTVLPQGFDPADFDVPPVPRDGTRMRLVYSGIFYDAQTPDAFLQALALLLARRPGVRPHVEAVFVGLVPGASRALATALGLDDLVHYTGYLPHREAVRHLRAADVLWMTVGRRPGAEGISTSKLYEYFGAQKPILALVPEGAVREALAPYGAAVVTGPDDVEAVADALEGLYERWRAGSLPAPDRAYVRRFDRRRLAGELAALLGGAG
ncbi:glycosyltransferase [Rhodocaloribacter litoris]|uniref:glycosyltransferase n=1 Tax=Rhodocaloribacter litoris TaxID=2558931 RepID=UPI001E5AF865|nr:glycosyltransferase [Rhodocaloribacter litoris]